MRSNGRTPGRRRRALLLFLLLLSLIPEMLAGDVKIIANSSVKTDNITAAELRRIYLQEKISLADGTHVRPVLEKDGPVHKAFLQRYVGVTGDDLQTYYRTLLFTGKGAMPKELDSDNDVVSYVARTPGAIGYVDAAASVEGVKTLAVAEPGTSSSMERKLLTRVEPDYPEPLRRLKIGGTVRLRILISEKGRVENILLLGGNPILAESAIAAVWQWVYSPNRMKTVTDISITFGSR